MNSNTKNVHSQDTFIIRVDHHQNDSWQGKVIWADENKTKRFRSSLELMRFLDEAIKKTGT